MIVLLNHQVQKKEGAMKFDVYAGNGIYVDTIEVESEEELADAAEEVCREWVSENMYWEPVEED